MRTIRSLFHIYCFRSPAPAGDLSPQRPRLSGRKSKDLRKNWATDPPGAAGAAAPRRYKNLKKVAPSLGMNEKEISSVGMVKSYEFLATATNPENSNRSQKLRTTVWRPDCHVSTYLTWIGLPRSGNKLGSDCHVSA
uniref:Uncharacterized protein n=1 Tax=Solanum tuberosum TaxID=4113 RepID=M1DS68_SOLTU